MRHLKYLITSGLLITIGLFTLPVYAAETARQEAFFTNEIFPLLKNSCFQCHSHQADKIKGDLVMDSRQGLLKGGSSGPAIVPGNPGDSLLILAVSHVDPDLKMPPVKGKTKALTKPQVKALAQWIKAGAVWPTSPTSPEQVELQGPFTDQDRDWWAFQPVVKPSPPALPKNDWPRNDIDTFILRKLRQEGLSPAPEASRETLIRRLYFDLCGLPPTPEEVAGFVQDESPDAYRQLVDRLLESPRYGERWARHWLDLVRFAESDGYKSDDLRPQAWRYRDYVIRSLNEDKPYDQFVTEQLAGDELAPHDPEVMVATGFLRNGIYEYNQRNVRGQWNHMLYDITDVTGEVFMGMGMACARCHNHKFDPILQKDYYRLLSFFAPLNLRDDIPLATPGEWMVYQRQLTLWEEATTTIRQSIDDILQPHLDRAARDATIKFPEEIQTILNKPTLQRNPLEKQLADLAYRQVIYEHDRIEGKIKDKEKERLADLRQQLAAFEHLKPAPLPQSITATDIGPTPPATIIPKSSTGEDIAPGYLSILSPEPARIPTPPNAPNTTGRRSALARWLTRPENPLTSRVMVNRIWQHHFSSGLVATTSDFGRLGELPSHPELLDWLAAEFVERGWSLKAMHRLMVNSATYRQSADRQTPQAASMKDPENRWLWRMNMQRLDGEQIRDALLAVTGELDLKMGGPSQDSATPRRTIYTKIKRNSRPELLDVFDPPDTYASTPQRNVTTTPTQSLLMINGSYTLKRAQTLSRELQKIHGESRGDFVRTAYERVLGRSPSENELGIALQFLSPVPAADSPVQVVDKKGTADRMPGRDGMAALIRPNNARQQLVSMESDELPDSAFTIEAYVRLESIYDDASVRTIAAQWDSHVEHPGWALGVTGKKTRYIPQNLILQRVGSMDEDGKGGYEVVVSGLKLELGRSYYVAASVQPKAPDQTGVRFYLKDLAKANEPLQKTRRGHQTTSTHRSKAAFTIGGRQGQSGHAWDGWIDDVRLSSGVLTEDELALHQTGHQTLKSTVGFWVFENEPGFYQDLSPGKNHLQPATAASAVPVQDPGQTAREDFCHALLNANEFLYVD